MHSPKLPCVALALILFAPQLLLAQYAISTVAGGGPNNLAALKASIGYPVGVAFDTAGNTYIADSYSSDVLKVDTSGNVTVVAGNGTSGYSGDGGPATSGALNNPEGLFVDGSGNIFIADTGNGIIRVVNTGTTQITVANTVIPPGDIQTVAGSYQLNLLNGCIYAGDGKPATSAQLCDPYGVFVDAAGDIFIADTSNERIREVAASNGTISTVAGNGTFCTLTPCGDGGAATSAQLDFPEGVFVDSLGNIYIADTDNSVIRVVNPATTPVTVAGVTIPAGDIQTVAGDYYDSQEGSACGHANDGQLATTAQLCGPDAVFVDGSGNIFIADTDNFAIREIAASTTDIITAVAGTLGTEGYSPNGTLATSAELNYPNAIFVDTSGDLFIADTDNFVIREVAAPISTGTIQTTVGNNTLAYSGDGGSAVNAELNAPVGVSADGLGDIFIADQLNNVIRVANTGTTANTVAGVVIQPGDIQTVAGSYYVPVGLALCDYSGDGGSPTLAQLCEPSAVFIDGSGNIFIADTSNNAIRAVNTSSAALALWGTSIPAGDIATVAGNGTNCRQSQGVGPTCGDGGLATSAELSSPQGVFVDSAENIFIADTDNHVIREVAASSGIITTVAGNYAQCSSASAACGDGGASTGAQLSGPAGVFVDLYENIYIADTGDNRIRAVNTSSTQAATIAGVTIPPLDIATVAGTGNEGYSGDGAVATSALLAGPSGVFVDTSQDIFITDTINAVIREVVAATTFIETVAGNNTAGFSGDDGEASSAELNTPLGLFGTPAGNLFVADTDNSRIRELVPSITVAVAPTAVSVVVNVLQQFTATVTGSYNTSVTWQVNGVVGGNSTVGTISTAGVFQAPTAVPTPATVTITAISSADNTTSAIAQATIVNASTTVSVAVSPSGTTQLYTTTTQQFTATVTGSTNQAVTWYVEGSLNGNATFGTISAGLYIAPASVPSPATVVIMAVSQADSTAIGTASVTVVAAPSAAAPPPQTTSPGGTATYSVLLNENVGWNGGPVKLSCLQSSLPPGATCGFFSSSGSPITTITPGAQACRFR